MRSHRLRSVLLYTVYLSAGYQFLRYYVSLPYFYLRLPEYFSGTERLPFQFRVLPILFLEPMGKLRLLHRIAAGRVGPFHNPDRIAFFLLSALALCYTTYYTLKLYQALTSTRRLHFLVYPILIFILIWTYVIHIEQDFSYPYDMPSVAFFTAGIYFVYQRKFLPLVGVILIGTWNRETTIFLIGLYLLDVITPLAITPVAQETSRPSWRSFSLSQIPWLRLVLLCAIWLAIKSTLYFCFRWNDHSEDYLRIHENLLRLITPNYWPAALNLFGYLLPFVLLFRSRIVDRRFANYLYILIPWFAVVFVQGILLETRVYGELSAYIAVASVLILEESLAVPNEPFAADFPSTAS